MDRELQLELNKRDKKRHLDELNELESDLASAHKGVFWATFNLLILNPILTAGAVYYFVDQIQAAAQQRTMIANLGSSVKYTAIGLAITFTGSSLTLLYYLWRIASLQREIAKIRVKTSRLE